MSKPASLILLAACATVAGAMLTGCSAGALPGGSTAAPGTTVAPTRPAASSVPPEDDLTAVPAHCPKASEVSPLAGFTVPDPSEHRSAAGLACTYASSNVANDMQINFHAAASGTTAATVKAEIESGGGPATAVSGLGDAAFSVSPSAGGAGLLVWNKGVEFSIVDAKDVDGLRRVALGILAD
jgi:hypothetical protein